MAERPASELAALKRFSARHWLEVSIQTGFSFGLLLLASGLMYPLYAFWPFPLNGFWMERGLFLLEWLPYAIAFLTQYLLGCWQWLQLHHSHSRPFRRFWLGRQLAMSLAGVVVIALPLQTGRLLGMPSYLAALAYGLGLFAVCGWLWPWLAGLRSGSGKHPWLSTLILAVCQALGIWLMLQFPLLAALLLFVSVLLLPLIASAWTREVPEQAGDPWQTLFGLVLVGFAVMGATAWWSWRQMLPESRNIDDRLLALQAQMHLERPPLRGKSVPGNAYEDYQPIFGHSSMRKPLLAINVLDSDRIRGMFDLYSGAIHPDLEMIAKYRPVLAKLDLAANRTRMQYPHGDGLLPMPELGLMQDLSLLRLADALSRCRPNDCLAASQAVLDNLRMLQDIALHGFATPMMVAYKMERISISALGLQLRPEALTPAQWQILLSEWRGLLAAENAHFDEVIGFELLFARRTLISLLPQLEADVDATSGSLPEWLGMMPYIRLGLPEIEAFGEDVQTYLSKPVHDQQLWETVQNKQLDLIDNNPFVRSVLIDVRMVIRRYREHQSVLRGFYQHLALQAYYAETGRYPERIEALVPRWLPVLPVDPYTGRPFVYQPSPEGYKLYSVGPNLRADGKGIYYGQFHHIGPCKSDEIVFAPAFPSDCRE